MDFDTKTGLWLPPKPAIIRKWRDEDTGRIANPLDAQGRLSMMPGLMPVIGGSAQLELVYVSATMIAGTSATLNYGNFTTSAQGLVIAVCVARGDTNRTVSSISIGGANGTLHIGTTSANTVKTGIASRVLNAGVHNVTMTLSGTGGSNAYHSCAVWLLRNYESSTPFATALNAVASGTISTTMNIPAGGIAVYGCFKNTSGEAYYSSATQRFNNQNGRRHVYADKETSTLLSGHVETVSFSTTSGMVSASWR